MAADAVRGGSRLRDRADFRWFWTAATISDFGTYVTGLAIQVLVVVTLHEGAAGVGVVNAARWLPYLALGLVVGVLVDRVRRRPLLVATDLARGALLIAVPVLAVTGGLTIAVLAGFLVVFGLLSVVNDAATQSLLPRLVPVRLLTRANARLDQSDAVAQSGGPALAGGVVALLTAPWAVLVDAVSYLLSGLLLLRVHVVEPPSARLSLRGVGREAREGLRWIYRHRTLRPYALGTHAWFLCFAVVNVVVPPFALRTLHLGAVGLGIALAAGGVGALLGALAAPGLGARWGAGRVVIAGHAGTAVAVALLALSWGPGAGWLVFGVGELALGLAMGSANANEMAYKQSITPDRLQGRSNAIMRSTNRAMIVVGAPLGGLLADAIGFRVVLWGTVAGFVLVAAGLATTPYRSARLADAA
ncbi:MFS-type transporter involved in bile tolerance, Atg22 family [Jatrophihabitans endophyticus]|uniref:MFS-type transporter involved in bile tolerance, Atg22 family n=1 Tax=Jatrophihabitans endophyticus TaxID=1206085 RepID=A0A1M5HSL5_9ACTN|nr:MFS transporter [Jatrophihabitans endophyticus]SHG18842.1 MFS-type transporter involved in bile tolerance, Atg22 family [Jatrophihabitans endophyticus]